MARQLGRLNALAVGKMAKPGRYPDGGGLYLLVGPTGAKSWVFRYKIDGRERWMGLGPLHTLSLSDARTRAREARLRLLDGVDPLDVRQRERARRALEDAMSITFDAAAAAFIQANKAGWRNAKHADQWQSTLNTYASPVFGSQSVAAVDTALVLKALEAIWTTKPETASRLRGRVERVLDWAKVRGYREGENPARWRGHLDKLLPARRKVRRVSHHAALPYAKIGDFMAELRRQNGMAALALEFAILTAARTGEVIGGRRSEIADGVWTIPADRMKAEREHRVPLSPAAQAVIERAAGDDFLFPGPRKKRGLSNMAMLKLLARMERSDLTVHGFRSTFRDWAAERTAYPAEVVEMALAHAVTNKVEAAYRRGDLFEKRRRLMDDWARFCAAPPAGNVTPIREGVA